nr:MAG TPA: minor capsid protein 2 [Caudoviricetes sp.]
MEITTKSWNRYRDTMSGVSKKAEDLMREWLDKHGTEDYKAFLDYANALVMHYGESSGALACKMYDELAEAQKAIVPAAEMVDMPSYGEVAKAVNGAKRRSVNEVPRAVGRIVKQVGADTTLKNAKRDHAEVAWVPAGDTCAFCAMLASRGWEYVSKDKLKGGHAEHIHANCDCQYTVRFDGKSTVKGYDPEKYREMYENAKDKKKKMAMNNSTIWPKKRTKISIEEYKELMQYAREHGIELMGFKQYDGIVSTIKDLVDDAEQVAKRYPGIISGKKRLTIRLSELLDDEDFAETQGHIININANAFRDIDVLRKEYAKLVDKGWFVKGTDYHSIIYHELGHVVANKYQIDILKNAEIITGKKDAELLEFIKANLSQYAGSYVDGREIIAESFSSVFGSGNSEFALKFIETCDSII